jgi:hypothetical protein
VNRTWKKSAATVALFVAGAAALALPASASAAVIKAAPGWPDRKSGDFVRKIDNPWFPLLPGMRWVSTGVKDGKKSVDHYVVTQKTKDILGVAATVVRDTLTQKGKVVEGTWDWYAQDKQGNVWYLGERTREYNSAGQVISKSGSWQTGVKGARPGIFMPAHPKIGAGGYQEYWPGQALDKYRIMSLSASVTVPYGTFTHNTLRTRETTALEPGIVDGKNYAKGIGQVAEQTVKGPKETSFLVTFKQ